MVILWYGLIPIVGALYKRYKWHIFRKRFDELRLNPILDYHYYCRHESENHGRVFRFTGGFESITDGKTLWIRSENLTVPVSLQNAETYLLPMQKSLLSGKDSGVPELFDPGDETPEKIRWERVSALTEGAKVFVGGILAYRDGRWSFVSTKENPLIVIFYDGPDLSFTTQAIRAGRQRGEYWNIVTPYSLFVGVLCLIFIAVYYLPRPAFQLTVIVSFTALFIPLYTMIPPGLLFTVMYRRLTWRARILRSYSDLARLPLRYLSPPEKKDRLKESSLLPNGELYGYIRCAELPQPAQDGTIPLLLPEFRKIKRGEQWYIFGVLRNGEKIPSRPDDPFATFGILPGNPKTLSRTCQISAYILELLAWIVLLTGIGLNIFFLRMILSLF